MTRFLKVLICSVAAICGHGAAAQESMAQTRTIYERGFDLVGADLAQIFDTTLPACEAACVNTAECEAFTFNQTSNSCFPKRDITGFLPFEGAISGRIYPTDPAALAGADARIAELSFLREQDFEAAATLTALSRQPLRNVSPAQQAAWFRAVQTDFSADWLAFAAVAQPENSRITRMALPAYVKAYLRALWPEDRRAAALGMALALEEQGRGRQMIDALRLAQTLQFDAAIEAMLEEAIGIYGFRVVDTTVESDSATPRICAVFSESLSDAGTDYTPFVQVPEAQLVVDASGTQLCIDGVQHGSRYRAGLPAASGETLHRSVDLSFYVRDRAPAIRLIGRAYVLPRLGDIAIPIQTVNI